MDLMHTAGAHMPAYAPRPRGTDIRQWETLGAPVGIVWYRTATARRCPHRCGSARHADCVVQCPQRRADLVLRRSPPQLEQPLGGCAAAIVSSMVEPSAAPAERAAGTQRAKPHQPPPLTRSRRARGQCERALRVAEARDAGCDRRRAVRRVQPEGDEGALLMARHWRAKGHRLGRGHRATRFGMGGDVAASDAQHTCRILPPLRRFFAENANGPCWTRRGGTPERKLQNTNSIRSCLLATVPQHT